MTYADLRRETDKRELHLTKEIKDLREKLSLLQKEREKAEKAAQKSSNKEMIVSLQHREQHKQQETLMRALQVSETALKALKHDLQAAEEREKGLIEANDAKMRSFLVRIRSLEEEIASLRATNAFLKRQLSSLTVQQETLQTTHAQTMHSLERSLSLTQLVNQNSSTNNSPLPHSVSFRSALQRSPSSPSPSKRFAQSSLPLSSTPQHAHPLSTRRKQSPTASQSARSSSRGKSSASKYFFAEDTDQRRVDAMEVTVDLEDAVLRQKHQQKVQQRQQQLQREEQEEEKVHEGTAETTTNTTTIANAESDQQLLERATNLRQRFTKQHASSANNVVGEDGL